MSTCVEIAASDPCCPSCNKPRLQSGMCWRCRNPGVLTDEPAVRRVREG